MATATQASPEELTDFLREVSKRTRARPTTRQRESRTAANSYKKRLAARQEFETSQRQQNLAYAQALGEERASNAALREQSVINVRRQNQKAAAQAAIPGAIASRVGGSALKGATGSPIAGTLGSVLAAIAIAIILYIVLNNAAGVQGTSNSILSFITALTSTDPLFKASATSTSSTSSAPASSSNTTAQNPNTGAGTNKGGA